MFHGISAQLIKITDINTQNNIQNSSLNPGDKKGNSLEGYVKRVNISKGIQFIVDQLLSNGLHDIKNKIFSERIGLAWNTYNEKFYTYLQEGRGVRSALIRTIANDEYLNKMLFGGRGMDKFLLKKNINIFCQRLAIIFGLDKRGSTEDILIILGMNRNDIMLAKLSVVRQVSVYLNS